MLKKSNGTNLKEKNGFRPRVVAFIPVRGGSKSIPLKNIKPLGGKPLVYWVVKAASETELIDKVFVATEDNRIRQTVLAFGLPKVTVVDRKIETTTDTASTESAMLDFAKNHEFEYIVLIQATSPLLETEYLNQGITKILSSEADSVISVVRQKRFLWEKAGQFIVPTNYRPEARPRRQDFDGYLVENGAFYITSRSGLLETGCRISGKVVGAEMPEDTYFEIDEQSDWTICEQLLKSRKRENQQLSDRIKKIKMLLTDCDGVLTDGGMYYSEHGDELKKFNTKDGIGMELLRGIGIKIGIITGEERNLIKARAKKLKVDDFYMGVQDKACIIEEIKRKHGLKDEEIAYIGDDRNDIEVFKKVGFGCAPADAIDEVKTLAHYITKVNGGNGVLREIAELILRFLDTDH